MAWHDTHLLLRQGLRRELRSRWGHISEIERKLSLSEGHLGKLCAGTYEFKLDLFLKALDALEIDPGSFFARVLGSYPRPADVLADLERGAPLDRPLERMLAAAARVASGEPPAPQPDARPAAELVREIRGCGLAEQRRRLRKTRRYRTHAFVRGYLEHLDTLRFDHAPTAARLAETVAIHLIPELPGPRAGRIALACRALCVFASARRVKGRIATAARALRCALELAQEHGLRRETAEILQRGANVQKDEGDLERALGLLSEALVVQVESGSPRDLAKVLIDRGKMQIYGGDVDAAVVSLERALGYLDGCDDARPIDFHAAFQYLAYAVEQTGDLETAERWLEKATSIAGLDHTVYGARLAWQRALLALKRKRADLAEELLRPAREVLAEKESAQPTVLVSLDLLGALLAQGKTDEAAREARDMAWLLKACEKDRLTVVAIGSLIRAALGGELTADLIREVRRQIAGPRPPRREPARSGKR